MFGLPQETTAIYEKAVSKVSLALISVLLLSTFLLILLPRTQASTSPQYFSDDFSGNSLDMTKWVIQPASNGTGSSAFGGSIQVANGILSMSSDGSTFPCISTNTDPFPVTGDFVLEFDVTFTHIGSYGSGIVVSDTAFMPSNQVATPNAPDPASAHGLKVWADSTGVNIFFFGSWIYKADAAWLPGGSGYSFKLIFRLEYTQGIYSVFLNNKLLGTQASAARPNAIVIGHPPVSYLPLFGPGDWTSFEVGQVSMLPSTSMFLGTSAASTNLGLTVNLKGNLTQADGSPLGNTPIVFSYLPSAYSTWTPLASTVTNPSGTFEASWMPMATGNFSVKAQWMGNDTCPGTFDVKNISISYSAQQPLFFVESNSTLSSLAFNSTSDELSFTVSGESGTTGYVRFLISKDFLSNGTDLKLYFDAQQAQYAVTSEDNSWLLYFTYHHSAHSVIMQFSVSSVPEFSPEVSLALLAMAGILIGSISVLRRSKRKCWA